MTDLFPRFKGILTDCHTNEEHEVELRFKIEDGSFQLIGGPTGYESFKIDSNFDHFEEICQSGWCACMGTKPQYDESDNLVVHGWDKLVIPGHEMRKALSQFLEA